MHNVNVSFKDNPERFDAKEHSFPCTFFFFHFRYFDLKESITNSSIAYLFILQIAVCFAELPPFIGGKLGVFSVYFEVYQKVI